MRMEGTAAPVSISLVQAHLHGSRLVRGGEVNWINTAIAAG
jgi:hypothetical protein